MSDIPADFRAQLDLRAEIARIDRDRAEGQKLAEESRKLSAERDKLTAESAKFAAEQGKLIAEGAKLNRDRWLAPWILLASLASGAIGGLVGHLLR